MIVRLKWGREPNPAALPNWRLIDLDEQAQIAVVEIPDGDVPPHHQIREHLSRTQKLDDPPAQRMPSAHKARWHEHLDERYQEHRGEFRPPLA